MYTGNKKPDPGMMVNGMLAGLVAITAPCAFVQPWAAAVIGIIAGVLVIVAVRFIETPRHRRPGRRGRRARRRAARSACSRVGIFADGSTAPAGTAPTHDHRGRRRVPVRRRRVRASSSPRRIGVVVIWTVIFGIAFAFFKIQNALMKGGIRPPAEEELEGMDMPEMGALAYPEFVHHEQLGTGPGGSAFSEGPAPVGARRRLRHLIPSPLRSGPRRTSRRGPSAVAPRCVAEGEFAPPVMQNLISGAMPERVGS